jgi:LAO/AO transport system kinase
VFVVNKSDREGSEAAVRDLQQMIRMGAERSWTPPVVSTAAATGEGIDQLWDAIDAHRAHLERSGELLAGRRERLVREVESLATERVRDRVSGLLREDPALADDLLERRTDPYAAAAILAGRVGSAEP